MEQKQTDGHQTSEVKPRLYKQPTDSSGFKPLPLVTEIKQLPLHLPEEGGGKWREDLNFPHGVGQRSLILNINMLELKKVTISQAFKVTVFSINNL